MAARNWTPEQRARQADKIRQWQPWDKSTGARTAEGKAVSSRNALKGGLKLHIRAMVKVSMPFCGRGWGGFKGGYRGQAKSLGLSRWKTGMVPHAEKNPILRNIQQTASKQGGAEAQNDISRVRLKRRHFLDVSGVLR